MPVTAKEGLQPQVRINILSLPLALTPKEQPQVLIKKPPKNRKKEKN